MLLLALALMPVPTLVVPVVSADLRNSSFSPPSRLIPIEILPHCEAVPLGVMVRGIMESLLDAEALEELLQVHAPEQYTLELTIDALVGLLIQVSAGQRALRVRCLHC